MPVTDVHTPRPDRPTALPADFAARAFRRVADLVARLLTLLVVLALMMGLAKVFLHLRDVWSSESIAAGFDVVVGDVLSMFVVLELLRSVIEYGELQHLKLSFIVDASTVFVLREVMIGLFRHALEPAEVGALAVLLLILGLVRTAAIRLTPTSLEER